MATEKRLIDANAFERVYVNGKSDDFCNGVLYVLDMIDAQPTVDAVEVVRCKDCDKISPSVTPIKDAVWCREFRAYMPCGGFCSYGERRTNVN